MTDSALGPSEERPLLDCRCGHRPALYLDRPNWEALCPEPDGGCGIVIVHPDRERVVTAWNAWAARPPAPAAPVDGWTPERLSELRAELAKCNGFPEHASDEGGFHVHPDKFMALLHLRNEMERLLMAAPATPAPTGERRERLAQRMENSAKVYEDEAATSGSEEARACWQADADDWRYIAALLRTPAGEWRDISTAPKDGTAFLVSGGVAHWHDGELKSLTGMDYPGRKIQWACRWWQPLPFSSDAACSHGTPLSHFCKACAVKAAAPTQEQSDG